MNFDFKNVQRRVYDALNVLTALDMIKKDRNKIEFVRDIHEVFGDGSKHAHSTPEKSKEDRLAEVAIRARELQEKKEAVFQSIKEKRQYLSEITVQVALLKKLVRRNLKVEDSDTDMNTPDKAKNEGLSLEKFQHTKKIHLPMLILEFPKSADLEVLMNEDHKELIILSDTHWNLYNDNHVLMNTELIETTEQGNIENLYDAEVKPLGAKKEIEEESNENKSQSENDQQDTVKEDANEDQEMKPPSPSAKMVKQKVKPRNDQMIKGQIMNISSPFKENVYKENGINSPFWKSFLSPLCSKFFNNKNKNGDDKEQNIVQESPAKLFERWYHGSPLLKNEMTPSYYPGHYANALNTPGSNYESEMIGIKMRNGDWQGGEEIGQPFCSPFPGLKHRLDYDTPLRNQVNQFN